MMQQQAANKFMSAGLKQRKPSQQQEGVAKSRVSFAGGVADAQAAAQAPLPTSPFESVPEALHVSHNQPQPQQPDSSSHESLMKLQTAETTPHTGGACSIAVSGLWTASNGLLLLCS